MLTRRFTSVERCQIPHCNKTNPTSKVIVFLKKVKQFIRETEAATSVEYAVMLMLIVGGCIAAVEVLGGNNGILWGGTMEAVDEAMNQ